MSLANEEPVLLQIGKDGVTPESAQSAEELYNTHELFKVSCLKTCPDTPEVAADKLSKRTHSLVVKVIGRRFILYRPFRENPKIVLPG